MIKLVRLLSLFVVTSLGVCHPKAWAGQYTIMTNSGKSGINTSHTISGINATYYRDLTLSYHFHTKQAFLGYAAGYIRISCNGVVYVSGKSGSNYPEVPGDRSYTDNMFSGSNNCGLSTATILFDWGGFAGPSFTLSNISLMGWKDAPIATPQSVSVNRNSSTGWTNLLASDPQNAPMTVTVTSPPAHGTLSWNGMQFNYTPTSCYYGTDSFQYYVTETIRNQTSSTVTVSINVNHVAFPPGLNALSNRAIPWHSSNTVALSGIAPGQCSSGTATITATSSNTAVLPHPTVTYTSPNATGSITLAPIQPPPVQKGVSTITVKVNDGVNETTRTFDATVDWVSLLHK